MQEQACKALCNLGYKHADNRVKVAAAGGIESIGAFLLTYYRSLLTYYRYFLTYYRSLLMTAMVSAVDVQQILTKINRKWTKTEQSKACPPTSQTSRCSNRRSGTSRFLLAHSRSLLTHRRSLLAHDRSLLAHNRSLLTYKHTSQAS